MKNKKTILITGSSGFVGTNLMSYCAQFPDIILKRFSRESADSRESLIKEFEDVNTVVHVAGKAHDLKKVASPQEYYDINFELTKKLYNVFLESGAEKFIFISTVKAIADASPDILTELYEPNPKTHYGKSKLMAEIYIQTQKLIPGKLYYILRPSMIHGPGNKGNLNSLYKLVSKNIPWPLGAFINKRSFLSIENLCFAIYEMINRDNIPIGVYNIADNEPLSTNEVVHLIRNELMRKSLVLKVPKIFIQFLAVIGNILHLPFNIDQLKKLTQNYVVSNAKLISALGKDLPLDSRKGMQLTIRSFKR